MPLNLGSSLISKVTGTSSEFFNRKMWALLDTVMTAELEYELSDPKLFVKHKDYVKLGPLGVVAQMQATHGMLLSQHLWPALTSTLPQNNNATVNGTGTGGTSAPALNGRRCFRCNGEHLVQDCPQPTPEGGSTGGGTGSGAGATNRVSTPLVNENQQM